MYLNRHYQNGYVTGDMAAAVEALKRDHAVSEVTTHDVKVSATTAEGEGELVLRLGFAWAGDLQYELIQPMSGFVGLYREAIAPDRPLTFHHVAMRTDDFDGLQAEIRRQGRRIALLGESGPTKFLYVDARDTLGHYLEYVSAPPGFWATFPKPV